MPETTLSQLSYKTPISNPAHSIHSPISSSCYSHSSNSSPATARSWRVQQAFSQIPRAATMEAFNHKAEQAVVSTTLHRHPQMDQAYSRRVFSPIEASVREASDRETSSKPASNHKASRISAKAASRKTPLILEKSTVKRNFNLPYRASNTRVSKATSAREAFKFTSSSGGNQTGFQPTDLQ